MAGVMARGGPVARRRRTMNEINMVPFIDVMLVLLIIFMVSAPLITTGVVDLPSVGRAKQRPQSVIEIVVGLDEKLKLKVDKGDPTAVALTQLVSRVREAQKGQADVPVVISADRQVKYESVVKVMDMLQRAGVQRVGLSVKQGA
ncbi:ExbD/TolR family protein [Ideonella sp.]|uniref:ExbD/TolR family protein n=1 Tax=Ideonella sp. TaxID=1929293 RepID=UPI0035B22B04